MEKWLDQIFENISCILHLGEGFRQYVDIGIVLLHTLLKMVDVKTATFVDEWLNLNN